MNKHQRKIADLRASPRGREASQRRRLSEINDFLLSRDLNPLPGRLGIHGHDRGEYEIIGVQPPDSVISFPFLAIVGFDVLCPDGVIRHYAMRFQVGGAKKRAVLVLPIINGQLVFVRQFRPAVGAWCTEAPRQFARNSAVLTLVDRKLREARQGPSPGIQIPLGLVGRELGPALADQPFVVERVTLLDDGMPQDTGYDTTQIQVWLVEIDIPGVDNKDLKDNSSAQFRSYALDQILKSGQGGRPKLRDLDITDALTRGALDILREHLG